MPEEKAAVAKQKRKQRRAKRKKEARDNLTKEEIQSLIEQKIGKKVEIDVRQMEAGRRFEDHFVDLENLINMEITVEDE